MRLYIITCMIACIVVHLEAVPISYKDVDPKDADADERKQLLDSLTKEFETRYSSKHFVKDAKEVQKTLQGLEGKVDDEEEGYTKRNAKSQRWMSRTFMWGHTHNFGNFTMPGAMGNRHLWLLSIFGTKFPFSLEAIKDSVVLDVGTWTGGTTLSLLQLGAKQVVGMEEVHKYANAANYLLKSFGLDDRAHVNAASLYTYDKVITKKDYFDVVYFPGVLYHLSDPIVAIANLVQCIENWWDDICRNVLSLRTERRRASNDLLRGRAYFRSLEQPWL